MAAIITVNSKIDKNILLQEAVSQEKMVHNLYLWLKILLVLSGVGIVLVWWGFSGTSFGAVSISAGSVITAGSVLGMLLIQKAITNGRNNINRIIAIAQNK